MKLSFMLALGLLIITTFGANSALASSTEKKTVKPAHSGSATERPAPKAEDKANTAPNHGSGTEGDSASDTETTEEQHGGSTSEREAPKPPAGSGSEREVGSLHS